MTLITIFLLALITFSTRYLFLHPKTPVRLGPKMIRFLSFSAPAVLTAIWVPIIFVQQGQLMLSWKNPYLVAATVAVLVAAKSKSIYLTLFVSVAVFVAMRFFMQ
ncbi:AzlD domain-containing protein [Thalassotalea piscium]|uniref:Branched-subunit amino acid transport protein n=1 Tax=Thalassotalea piscium TaxID=1230533 RepID=A0A7X0TV91_9GAMM|nr:AzlD domain-containing protein [Thalassotalea piscium]MBB6545008.1 branched-subunit amino acid transport protein [Thalassotalea piscium]